MGRKYIIISIIELILSIIFVVIDFVVASKLVTIISFLLLLASCVLFVIGVNKIKKGK